jgi:hypothetical protein
MVEVASVETGSIAVAIFYLAADGRAGLDGRWIVAAVVSRAGRAEIVRLEGAIIRRAGWERGFGTMRTEVGCNGLGLNLALAQGSEVIGDGFLFVEADLAGVGADETFVEYAAGKQVKAFLFDGAEHAGADFRGVGNGIELDAALLALFAKFVSELTHDGLRRAK